MHIFDQKRLSCRIDMLSLKPTDGETASIGKRSMGKKKSEKEVEEVIGNPVIAEFPENTIKVRRNLLLASSISIFLILGGARLDTESAILGFKFIGATDAHVRTGLLLVTGYFFIHFLWLTWDYFLEWRLRITGTRLAFITGARFTSGDADYPSDPRQSTLYSWWADEAKRVGNIKIRIEVFNDAMKACEEKLRALIETPGEFENLNNALRAHSETLSRTQELKNSITYLQETFTSNRIPVSLRRFDNWFQLFLRSGNLRWIVVDALIPLLTGGFALILLMRP